MIQLLTLIPLKLGEMLNMTVKEYKENKLNEYYQKDSEIVQGKKLVFTVMLCFVFARLLLAIVETVYSVANNITFGTIIVDYISLVVSLLFALFIYKAGLKICAFLAMAGGIVSLINLFFIQDVIDNFSIGNLYYNVYIITLIIVMTIQTIIMFLIMINKKSRKYFKTIEIVSKEIMSMQSNNNKKLK